MEFEDVLVQVGDFGKYQSRLMLYFLFPASAIIPWFSMNIFFLVSVPDHWCKVPELDEFNFTLEEQQLLIRPPADPKCSMYNINYSDFLTLPSVNWTIPEDTTTKPCLNGWQYDKTYYESTAASQWDLVCRDSHYGSLVLTLANVGCIIGTPFYGALSDKLGRKPIFFVTVFIAFTSAIISVLMTNFSAFIFFRVVNGSIMPSIFQLPYIVLLEIVGPNVRTRMNGIANTSWTFGLCFLPLIAWLSRSWVTLGLITSAVSAVYLIYWKLLPESPRWYVSQERYEDAHKVMMAIANKNEKKILPDILLSQLKELGETYKKERENEKMSSSEEQSPMIFFKYPRLRKHFLILTYCFSANIAAYYGLQLNATNLDGNEFLNFFLLALFELPGYLIAWWFMEAFGRRWCSVWTLMLTGVACLVPVFTTSGSVIPSMIGKLGSAAAFMAMYQQCAELYPTTVRALGLGFSGTVAVATSIAVPYIVYLGEYGAYIPFLVIALFCITAALSAAFLPETLNENLPQTVQDAEMFGSHQIFFSCNRRRRPSCHEPPPKLDENGRIEMRAKC